MPADRENVHADFARQLERELAEAEAKLQEQSMASADIEVLNNALNYFYPNRRTDGDEAADARQALFELRDRLEKGIPR